MKNNVKKISQCRREIEVEVPSEEVMKEFEKILTQFSKKAKIRGFRTGKIPKDIVKRMYYPEIKESLISSIAPKALKNEIKAKNLSPVDYPVIKDIYFKEKEPLRLKAQFEVWPEFDLPEYKNIEIKMKKISVTDDEINQSLLELQEKAAQYLPVEGRGVADDDYVILEIIGKDAKNNKLLPKKRVVVIAGNPQNEKALNEKLKGLKPDDETQIIIDYSKNHKEKKLAGKKIIYDIKVISIKEKKKPEIDDEFAKDIGDLKGLNDLKEKIKTEIMSLKERQEKREAGEEIIKKISDKLTFEIPKSSVQREYLTILDRTVASLNKEKIKSGDIEKIKEDAKNKAIQNIKNHLILSEIAKKENLKVSEKEINDEIEDIAKANNVAVEKVINSIDKEGKREQLKESILIKKSIDFLVENAII